MERETEKEPSQRKIPTITNRNNSINLTFSGDTAIQAYNMRMRVKMFEN